MCDQIIVIVWFNQNLDISISYDSSKNALKIDCSKLTILLQEQGQISIQCVVEQEVVVLLIGPGWLQANDIGALEVLQDIPFIYNFGCLFSL